MNVAQILRYMYPDANPNADYQVGDDGSGPRIVAWNYAKAPQPSDADLSANAVAAQMAEDWEIYRGQARVLLDSSDTTILRCYEHAVPVPAGWVTYRAALRAIVSAPSGDPTQPLPLKPAYPSGT
ncbi:XkdW family protein [Burkholderia sp. GbtcB21]|uniref:XkdW family protein n=1 Tax=Burkholderia sp. GbtcB21 TaxID=2824766 RepID=UPI001C2FB828